VFTAAGDRGFVAHLTVWLWFTVLFANFAEAIAEGRGKAQASTLRRARAETQAKPTCTGPDISGPNLESATGSWRTNPAKQEAMKPGTRLILSWLHGFLLNYVGARRSGVARENAVELRSASQTKRLKAGASRPRLAWEPSLVRTAAWGHQWRSILISRRSSHNRS
jgi:hypothetical protein